MSAINGEQGYLRIGELSRRTGVAPELLRAWERRYALLRPSRSEGGFRLYSEADERRVEEMRRHLRRGVAAAEAARLAVEGERAVEPAVAGRSELEADAARLRGALDAFDERAAQTVLDELFAAFTVETVLSSVILPYLAELGERWSTGEATVAQEHFASNLIRGRLLGIGRGWDGGDGPRAVLACAPGELHDLGLVSFGVVLARRGWRITYLGPDTPVESVVDTAERLDPDLVVVAATSKRRLTPLVDELTALRRKTRVLVAGAGATSGLDGIEALATDPVTAALAV
ncbi:MAG TPA: MerR family transcriptional regulator [Gaiellaceae bacterium]|nr:MerR family transcriptional regulator [Gaiellaceae bacterium]